MNIFFQSLLTNSPLLVGFIVLFFLIKQQSLKMDHGFKSVENEFKILRAEMRHGFKRHDNKFKRVKKRIKLIEKKIR